LLSQRPPQLGRSESLVSPGEQLDRPGHLRLVRIRTGVDVIQHFFFVTDAAAKAVYRLEAETWGQCYETLSYEFSYQVSVCPGKLL
jgi:hypothetical protein